MPDYQREFDGIKAKILVYYSYWSFLGVCAYFLFSAIGTLVYHVQNSYKDTSQTVLKEHEEQQRSGKGPRKNITLPWYFKITWFLQNVFFSGIILTTFLRWGVDTGEKFQYTTSSGDIHAHGITLLMVFVDIILIASPHRIQHVVYVILVGVIYTAFSGIYYLAGGTNEHHTDKEMDGDTYVYREKLDWGRFPKTTAFFYFMLDFVAAPLLHLFVYTLFKLAGVCVEWYYYCKQKHRK
ncbi:protein rolling stone-like [Amphiura filiformis]|uniref:protein rolling stone-like n=1 Tax=Amphiura filiformis TaxID=82378 RepID=UPI003B2126D8